MKDSNFYLFILLIPFILIPFVVNPVMAQCTDADGDGYYYEEGCGTPRDCNDADPDINPGAMEVCNGFDDNCDSNLDEGCDTSCDNPEKWGSDLRVTYASWKSEFPSLVWTGTGYGISWHDYRDGGDEYGASIYFARLDSSGNKIGSDVKATNNNPQSSSNYFPSLAWTGSEYGIAYSDDRDHPFQIYFSRLDSSGNKIGSDLIVSDNLAIGDEASLVWTGKEYGVAWHDQRYFVNLEICFAKFDSQGNKIGADIRVTYADSYSRVPSLVWTGSEYGVCWYDYRNVDADIYFARLDSSGNKIGSDIRVTNDPESSVYPSLVWTGSEFGITWEDTRDGNSEIYFSRLDSSGNKIGSDIRVTNDPESSVYPSLVWTGTEYGVSWYDFRNDNYEIYFARLDSSGSKIGSDLRMTYDSSSSGSSSLVWNGSDYGVSWDDNRDGNFEVYFNRIRCCDDADMDDYTEAPCSGSDCNDNDSSIYPGAPELCDGKDNNCDGTIDEGFPTPGVTTGLAFESNKETMNWDVEALAYRYDVMKGDLIALRSSGGDFASSLSGCLEEDSVDTKSSDPIKPESGQGFYYIVRAQRECKTGTCNTGQASQVGDRDSEIESSSNCCL